MAVGSSGTPRRLRIVFFVDRVGTLRKFASLVPALAERGHRVHLAFSRAPRRKERKLVKPLVRDFADVTWGPAPTRGSLDGWRPVSWLVRGLGDLARYSHPRYAAAPVLRRRTTGNVLRHIAGARGIEPVGRRLALRVARRLSSTTDAALSERVIGASARLERAIPTSRRIDRYLRVEAADVVLVTPVIKLASEQTEYLKSARRLGIPAAICVASWDNLTNKGRLRLAPERVLVWNELQRREAIELHGMPAERVRATGAALFDEWFERRPSTGAEEFKGRIGLDPGAPYVLYLCSSPFVAGEGEVDFVRRWIDSLRSSGDDRLRRLGVVIRPHPNPRHYWQGVDLGDVDNVVVWPREGIHPTDGEARSDYFDSLAHSAAVVGINTTAMIEAAIVGKSVLTVLRPEFAQETTLHFHYLLHDRGGFLHVGRSLDEHVEQLSAVLAEDASDADRRRRFVESFVRPHGLGRPATPILVDEVEQLAALAVDGPPRSSGTLLLRLALTVEAGLCLLAAGLARGLARSGGSVRRDAASRRRAS